MQYNLSLLCLQNAPKLLQQYIAVTSNKFGDFHIYSSNNLDKKITIYRENADFTMLFFNMIEKLCSIIKEGLKYVSCKRLNIYMICHIKLESH